MLSAEQPGQGAGSSPFRKGEKEERMGRPLSGCCTRKLFTMPFCTSSSADVNRRLRKTASYGRRGWGGGVGVREKHRLSQRMRKVVDRLKETENKSKRSCSGAAAKAGNVGLTGMWSNTPDYLGNRTIASDHSGKPILWYEEESVVTTVHGCELLNSKGSGLAQTF